MESVAQRILEELRLLREKRLVFISYRRDEATVVAEQLYRVGLDYAPDSSYARWRKEVQVLLGAAVHTSYVGAGATGTSVSDCLAFATLRLQELCVYSMMLGEALRADLALGAGAAAPTERDLSRVALAGGEILLDQMRWLTAADEPQPAVS